MSKRDFLPTEIKFCSVTREFNLMLTSFLKSPAGVTPEVDLQECIEKTSSEIQKHGLSLAPKYYLYPQKNSLKKGFLRASRGCRTTVSLLMTYERRPDSS